MAYRRHGCQRPLDGRQVGLIALGCLQMLYLPYIVLVYRVAPTAQTLLPRLDIGFLCYSLASFAVLLGLGMALTMSEAADPSIAKRGSQSAVFPDVENDMTSATLQDSGGTVAAGEERRWCDVCHSHVHTSSLHCRYCDKCVLRLDHHCFYVNNCIGQRNYRLFVVCLAWLFVYSATHTAANVTCLAVRVPFLLSSGFIMSAAADGFVYVVLAAQTALMTGVALFTGYLIVLHIELGYRGITTLEYSRLLYQEWEERQEKKRKKKAFRSVAGHCWCWGSRRRGRPSSRHSGQSNDSTGTNVDGVSDPS